MEYWDPLRKKSVAATPEEQVRQWFIRELLDSFAVPSHLMMSEAGFRFGGKQYRADILVFDREAKPLAVVECKRPDVPIDSAVIDQAMRYNMVLDVAWIILTNGISTLVWRRTADRFEPCTRMPDYTSMLCAR